MTLTGWGRTSHASVLACRPERADEVQAALRVENAGGILAYGGGRSYGDAALNAGGRAILTGRLNRILAFDRETGEVTCEPGVTFRDLIDVFVPHGLMPPASPGTAFATIGGAVANDVHGKNHDRHGSFGDHVTAIELMLADGSTRQVSPSEDADLFHATIGGLGLTGFMRQIRVRLLAGAHPKVAVAERRIADLDAYLAAFAEIRDTATFSVGWIDALARGRALGRGILETAEFAASEASDSSGADTPERPHKVPIDFPGFALNPLAVRMFNAAYLARVGPSGRSRVAPLAKFLYPLDAILAWNRIYGKRGFYQFQCVLPDAEAPRGLRQLLETIAAAGRGSFLAVLKTLGGEGRGYLSFPIRGFTLALDFPRTRGIEDLLGGLERIVGDRGGRIYLAKDALVSAESFQAMYPKVDQFKAVLARVDPRARFTSDLARRLGLKPKRRSDPAP